MHEPARWARSAFLVMVGRGSGRQEKEKDASWRNPVSVMPGKLPKNIAQDKKSGKSAYDDVSDKKKKSDSDPTYSENMKLSIKIMERARVRIEVYGRGLYRRLEISPMHAEAW